MSIWRMYRNTEQNTWEHREGWGTDIWGVQHRRTEHLGVDRGWRHGLLEMSRAERELGYGPLGMARIRGQYLGTQRERGSRFMASGGAWIWRPEHLDPEAQTRWGGESREWRYVCPLDS